MSSNLVCTQAFEPQNSICSSSQAQNILPYCLSTVTRVHGSKLPILPRHPARSLESEVRAKVPIFKELRVDLFLSNDSWSLEGSWISLLTDPPPQRIFHTWISSSHDSPFNQLIIFKQRLRCTWRAVPWSSLWNKKKISNNSSQFFYPFMILNFQIEDLFKKYKDSHFCLFYYLENIELLDWAIRYQPLFFKEPFDDIK